LRGLGLAGIEERVAQLDGTVHIAADRGRGTEIVVEIPVEPRHVDSRTAGR
jgi:signal transduction histidine kinase